MLKHDRGGAVDDVEQKSMDDVPCEEVAQTDCSEHSKHGHSSARTDASSIWPSADVGSSDRKSSRSADGTETRQLGLRERKVRD